MGSPSSAAGPKDCPDKKQLKKAKEEQTAAWVLFVLAILMILASTGMVMTGWRPFA